MILVGDCESNGLKYETTVIHCLITKDLRSSKWYFSFSPQLDFDPIPIIEEKIKPNQYSVFENHECHLAFMKTAEKVVFHNGFNFDYFVFNKLYPTWDSPGLEDSFILSCMFEPDRFGGHSLEAWGRYFRFQKEGVGITDWSRLTPLMLRRCISDVKLTGLLYDKLSRTRKLHPWEEAIRLEYGVARLNAQQEFNGVPFNRQLGERVYHDICREIDSIDAEILPYIPKICVAQEGTDCYVVGSTSYPRKMDAVAAGHDESLIKKVYSHVSKPFLKMGGYTKQVRDWFGSSEKVLAAKVRGPFTRVTWEQINLNSDTQVKAYLLSCGWKPTQWNYKKDKSGRFVYDDDGSRVRTSPKLTEDSFSSVQGDIPKTIAKRNILKHRRSQLLNPEKETGLLALIRDDGRIPAEGNPHATNTARYRHRKVVNIPKPNVDKETGQLIWYPDKQKVVYGTEFRAMFCTVPGYRMVGIDAKGLEARMEAHYCFPMPGGEEYARELLEGDVHSKNAIFFGTDRNGAKAPKYALTYGCQVARLAETLGISVEAAEPLFKAFWEGNVALSSFKKMCEDLYYRRGGKKGGYLCALDGRKLFIRSAHALVNTMFQSAGSICVKAAMCLLWNKWVPRHNIDAQLVIQMHDEWQALVREDHVEKYSQLALATFPMVGKYFQLHIPLEGDIKVGESWAYCH